MAMSHRPRFNLAAPSIRYKCQQCTIDVTLKCNLPIDPPALNPQYSNKPSNTGESSPTLTDIKDQLDFAIIKSKSAYIWPGLFEESPCFQELHAIKIQCNHQYEIESFPIYWQAWLSTSVV